MKNSQQQLQENPIYIILTYASYIGTYLNKGNHPKLSSK